MSTSPLPTSRYHRLRLFESLLRERLLAEPPFTQAAALAYNTLFSLLPMLVLALLVVSILSSSSNDMGTQVERWVMQQTGLDKIEVQGKSGPVDIAQFLNHRIEKVREYVQSPTTGLIAFATLLYGAISLMLVIERAFSHVYHAATSRSWSRRITLYWCVLTLGPLCVAASVWLTNIFHTAVHSTVGAEEWLLAPMSLLGGFLISWLLVFLLYKLVPETYVAWRSALIGSFFGALLWELGKYAFGVYLRNAVGYTKWYGTLGVVPLFMFWIYCTWNFLLVGLHIAYLHQYFASLARQRHFKQTCEIPVADLRWVLALGVLLHQRFKTGHPLAPEDATDQLGIPPEVADALLRALAAAGLALPVAPASQSAGYTLARPADTITAEDLLTAARPLCQSTTNLETPTAPANFAPTLKDLAHLESTWLRTHTLADLSAPAAI